MALKLWKSHICACRDVSEIPIGDTCLNNTYNKAKFVVNNNQDYGGEPEFLLACECLMLVVVISKSVWKKLP